MLVDEAFEICCECSEPGWDGYDALALSKEAFLNAKHFIDNRHSQVSFNSSLIFARTWFTTS